MNIEKILQGLSQEERLALLERLLREETDEEEPKTEWTIEERLTRLENHVFGRWRSFCAHRGWNRGMRRGWRLACGGPCCQE